LFDFGIARELKPKDRIKATDDYRCSGLTGSRVSRCCVRYSPFLVCLEAQLTVDAVLDFQRWMAPEVCLCLPYGLKADVYSFGLLFYQLLALKLPFGNIQEDRHYRRVVKRGTRPWIPQSLPGFLREKIKACWSPNPSDRPSFKDICASFPEDIKSLQMTKQRRSVVNRSLDNSLHSGHFTPSGHLTPSAHRSFES
jgi:serine/threonine protein kinase